jgi:hypothetical protein
MKNSVLQSGIILFAFVALTFLVSYTRPEGGNGSEAKQYTVISGNMNAKGGKDKFEADINQKLAEGWRLQGGICVENLYSYHQAIAK